MKTQIKILFALSFFLITKFSFADATADLWTALKTANYPNALTAITAGADVKNEDATFGTPLNFASCWADADVVKALIDAKSEINYVAPSNGYTPLMNAAAWGNVDAVKLLLAAGGDLKVKTKLGQTMLAVAITSCKLEIVKLLVDAGADPNEKYSISTITNLTTMNALLGCNEPKEKIVAVQGTGTALAKLGVTFPPRLANAQESDYTPLEDLAVYLLEKGADPNQVVGGTWGNILMQALDFGKTGIGKALIEHGATFDEKKGLKIKDPLGDNAIFPTFTYTNGDFVLAAVLSNKPDFVNLMVEKYPNLISKSYEGKGSFKCTNSGYGYSVTGLDLLMIAAEHGNPEIVKYLISKGAGKGKYAEAKWDLGHDKTDMCPMKLMPWTLAFAKASGNQEIIDVVKAIGNTKE